MPSELLDTAPRTLLPICRHLRFPMQLQELYKVADARTWLLTWDIPLNHNGVPENLADML